MYIGSNAVDCLMNSVWAEYPRKEDETVPYFASRADAVSYCNRSVNGRNIAFVKMCVMYMYVFCTVFDEPVAYVGGFLWLPETPFKR